MKIDEFGKIISAANHCPAYTADHFRALQSTSEHCRSLQSTADHYRGLQITTEHCISLQSIAQHYRALESISIETIYKAILTTFVNVSDLISQLWSSSPCIIALSLRARALSIMSLP